MFKKSFQELPIAESTMDPTCAKKVMGAQKGVGKNALGTSWFTPAVMLCDPWKKEWTNPSLQQTKQQGRCSHF